MKAAFSFRNLYQLGINNYEYVFIDTNSGSQTVKSEFSSERKVVHLT
jgi:hypothetical protein